MLKNLLLIVLLIFSVSALNAQTDQLNKAKELIQEREFDLAKPILEKLYDKDEENPEINYWYAMYSIMLNKYDDAIDFLDVAIDGDETNPLYYNMLGNAYGMKAQNSGAIKAAFAAPKAKSNWEKAVELKPDFWDPKIALFQYYLQAPGIMGGDDEKAKQIADEFISINYSFGHTLLANYYLVAEDDPLKAEKQLQFTLKTDSTDTLYGRIVNGNLDLLNSLGYYHLNEKNYSQSRQLFLKAIDLAPDRANPYDSLGDFYVALSKYDSALYSYDSALKQNPEFIVSKYNKAKMLEKLNRKDEAIKIYQEILKNNPNNRYAELAEERLDELE